MYDDGPAETDGTDWHETNSFPVVVHVLTVPMRSWPFLVEVGGHQDVGVQN
jgi:hypothetical protein